MRNYDPIRYENERISQYVDDFMDVCDTCGDVYSLEYLEYDKIKRTNTCLNCIEQDVQI